MGWRSKLGLLWETCNIEACGIKTACACGWVTDGWRLSTGLPCTGCPRGGCLLRTGLCWEPCPKEACLLSTGLPWAPFGRRWPRMGLPPRASTPRSKPLVADICCPALGTFGPWWTLEHCWMDLRLGWSTTWISCSGRGLPWLMVICEGSVGSGLTQLPRGVLEPR